MQPRVSSNNNSLNWCLAGEILDLEPWGPDGVRVHATNLLSFPEIPGALIDTLPDSGATVTIMDDKGIQTDGKLRAEICPDGTLHLLNTASGAVILEAPESIFNKPSA